MLPTLSGRLMWLFAVVCLAIRTDAAEEFSSAARVLQRRCLSCHNDRDRKGKLSLESKASAFADGYIEPGDPAGSHLIDLITPDDGKAQMPKDADPLSADEIAVITRWIDAGADWPDDVKLTEPAVADLNWWSLKPVERPAVPQPRASGLEIRTPIDAFISAELSRRQLVPSPAADAHTLVRRLYFDLIGLPPSPAEIEAFVQDPSPRAYERLVDGLLDSPHYGERWARHWLDVVHYADTHGYDKDKPRPHAWPYRDYVIRSFNDDKPYRRFVMEQIAGDALWPETVDGITATGFIAAGPWDFIGHAEVPETKIDGRIARHLDRDDMVTSTMNTFCSTTVQCARCHNHKFDPITQEHYYSLQAVFAALDRADRPYDISPQTAARRAALTKRSSSLADETRMLDEHVDRLLRENAGEALARIDGQIGELQERRAANGKARPEFGYHSQIGAKPDIVKWVQVDLGTPMEIAKIIYVGCHDTFAGIGHGFGFPLRYKIEASNDEQFRSAATTIVADTGKDVRNPGTTPQTASAPAGLKARFVRVTATRLAERKNDYIFALAELSVLDSRNENVALGQPVSSLDSIEAPVRWRRTNLVDGYYYGVAAPADVIQRLEKLNDERDRLLRESLSPELRKRVEANRAAVAATERELKSLPASGTVYAGVVHHGNGNFVGTGSKGGRPRTIHVLHRGNILQPRQEAAPGTLGVIPDSDWRFILPDSHRESDRRITLARWLVRDDNPLTWRSIVNRVWQYHFGRGLVDSPNDFGRMGKQPSHPELLDWLAAEFRDGQSFKKLHKLIVTSSVYRQASHDHEANRRLDSENVYLWRMNRRRLAAEEVRDAVLAVSGKLDRTMYGPGFRLFVLERPQHSPHYEYHKHDPDDPKSHRRSVYRFIVRSQPDPFMTTLDCADSSQSVPKRDETVTALQALSLLNNKFMLRMSEHFADRLQAESDDAAAQVLHAFRLTTGRVPNKSERDALLLFVAEHGRANLGRLLFNLNEFVFID